MKHAAKRSIARDVRTREDAIGRTQPVPGGDKRGVGAAAAGTNGWTARRRPNATATATSSRGHRPPRPTASVVGHLYAPPNRAHTTYPVNTRPYRARRRRYRLYTHTATGKLKFFTLNPRGCRDTFFSSPAASCVPTTVLVTTLRDTTAPVQSAENRSRDTVFRFVFFSRHDTVFRFLFRPTRYWPRGFENTSNA